ncbi:unnamed protein product [Adineta steineri]|uniref:ADP ribosyltransferase domain-containing protein n=1 Tax=Adineta steineri TaxID=433720 RepID=A0A815LPB3_9BILA|nr:unnamed protein product [Adineta steineri]CAF1408645.1 unnamed protein product [Adineta steineri]CAF3483916.1 unnamed protein product [Adineta steineri]CAF4116581.1 unnamed protein product [Adineta steineri]
MIIPDHVSRKILPLIKDISQLYEIYVLCNNQAEREDWTNVSKKVKGIFTDIESVYNRLEETVCRADIDMTPISIIPNTVAINLNELDPSFMYSQLLKEIILEIEFNENAKETFLNFCRQQYVDTNAMSKVIDEFKENYDSSKAIWWYTKEPFIYSVLNKALRIQDIGTSLKMGFFIRDLHEQIQQLHSETQQSTKMTLYRGQGLSNVDLTRIKSGIGGLLSFNNFLSTSIDPQVSLVFADSARGNPDFAGILFKIEVDSLESSIPFISLEGISYYSESEKEVLFSMHSMFRIVQITQIEDRLWQVELVLTSDTDEQLEYLTNYMRKELGDKTGWHRMIQLMCKMGNPELCLEAYNMVLDTTSENTHQEYSTLMINTLTYAAQAYFLMGHCKNAPFDMEDAFNVEHKSLTSNHSESTTIVSSISRSNDYMKDYETAIWCYEKILEIQQKVFPSNHLDLARTYFRIGNLYKSMKDYSTALSYFDKTLETLEKSFPFDHPKMATVHHEMGNVYQLMKDYEAALLSYKKTLEIHQKSLPSNHPDLSNIYSKLGTLYKSMEDHPTALIYFKEALAIQLKCLQQGHPDLVTSAINILSVTEPNDLEDTLSYVGKLFDNYDK